MGHGADTLVPGYTVIGFYINGRIANTIAVSRETGQAMDMNGCEIFDYPDLRSFQRQILSITKAKRKSPQQMARDAGCDHPEVLTNPVSYKTRK
jgi:hypothetical protein